MRTRRNYIFAWLGYFVALAVALYGMTEARKWAMVELDTPEARARQHEWQMEAKLQSEGKGPVRRRPVKAGEPPMLILLRDHFGAAAVTNLIAVTVFYWFLTFVIRGALQAKQRSDRPSDAERAAELLARSSESPR
ncbi:MAG: hypothetical protein K8U03_19830 [Planctomycetia bacterium]|nr:hypothetical protein [Planctomycetia bacterium]